MNATTTASHAASTTTAPARTYQVTRSAARQRSTMPHCLICQPSTKNGMIPIARDSENVESMFER
jgi:hypothetical protein